MQTCVSESWEDGTRLEFGPEWHIQQLMKRKKILKIQEWNVAFFIKQAFHVHITSKYF